MIHPSTRVLSQDSGYEAVEALIAPFPVWTGDRVEMLDSLQHRASELVKVSLVNGVEVVCSPDQLFAVDGGQIKAGDLTNSHLARLTDATFDFDYLSLNHGYLEKLTSHEIGVLIGL